MFTKSLSLHHVLALPSRRASAITAIAVMLLSAACADSTSPISGPELASQSINSELIAGPSALPMGFAVLATLDASCNGGRITGAVGTFMPAPKGSVSLIDCPMQGTVHVGDLLAQQEYYLFVSAYGALTPRAGGRCTTLTGTLAGLTLSPGTYCFDSSANLMGVLTLTGGSSGRWTFKIGRSGTGALLATNFSVVMGGGGDACNVTWWVRDAAMITASAFQGNILAGSAVTLKGGTLQGHAYAQGAVRIPGMPGTVVSDCSRASGS